MEGGEAIESFNPMEFDSVDIGKGMLVFRARIGKRG